VVTKLRPVVVGAAVAMLALGLPALAGSASASSAPPWEPDPNALGSLTLYSCTNPATASTCQVVTGGTNLDHLFDYAEASTTDPSTPPGNKAVVYFAQPEPATPTLSFPQGQESNATLFPNATAPYTGADPLATLGTSDGNLADFIATQTPPTNTEYENVYQIRLYTTSAAQNGTLQKGTYWEIDISVNPTAGTWVETYPTQGSTGTETATTTTLAALPATTTQQGSPVTLTAKVTAANSTQPAGSVEFDQDGFSVGTANVTSGSASITTSALLPSAPNGTNLTATFTPSNPATYSGSTSSALAYTVNPVAPVPAISGPHQAGATETCAVPTPDFSVTARFTWLANGKSLGSGSSIDNGAGSSLVVPGSAYKQKLQCEVSEHDGSGPVSSATSAAATVSLGKAPRAIRKPALSGSAKVGKTVKVKAGTWSLRGVKFTYQWLLNGKVIRGATKSSIKLSRADNRKKLSCRVTAHEAGYANGVATTSSEKVS
jgi:Bacterial Ig-like domain (group 3)